jgi:steroid delta-isomerase-like uncharacterized protein
MADNANFVRSLYEAWNKRDFDYLAESTAADTVLTVVGTGETYRGLEDAIGYNKMLAEAFPDAKTTIDNIIESGDTVVVEYTGKGTHNGAYVTTAGTIPATGRAVTLQFCDVYEIKNGKLQTRRMYSDSGALMVQLGLMAAQPTATQ